MTDIHEDDPSILDLRAYPLMTNPEPGWAYSSYVLCRLCHAPFVHLKSPVRLMPSNEEDDERDLVVPAESICGSTFELRFGIRAESTFITHAIIDSCDLDESCDIDE